jgi:predicted branched-subunit amino acid permease
MANRSTAFWRGARDCLGVPALAVSSALAGYGVMAHDNGLELSVTVASVLSLWGLPAMMTYADLVGAASGPFLMAVTIALINIRTLPMVVAALPLIRHGRQLRWSHFVYAQFISPTNWAQIARMQSRLSAAERPPYFLGFSIVMWIGVTIGTVLGFEYGAQLPEFMVQTLLFLTPFFVFLMMSTSRRRGGQWAVAIGAVMVPLAMTLSPEWGLLVGGLSAGTIGFLMGRQNQKAEP